MCGQVVCVSQLCVSKLCVSKLCVDKLGVREAAGGGGRRECTTKNKNPTQRCGEKNEFLPVDAAQKRSEFCVKVFPGEISRVERRQPLACGQF